MLVPGGRLILGNPDYGRWRWNLVASLYSRLVPGADENRHLAHYSRRELVAKCAAQGYELEAERTILGADMILLFRRCPTTHLPEASKPSGGDSGEVA